MNEINNVIKTGIITNVNEDEWTSGSKISVEIDSGGNRIRNIVIWAETVDGERPGMHIGYWSPISGYAYIDGCDGWPNATITNLSDMNLTKVTYEWVSPSADTVIPATTPVTTPVISSVGATPSAGATSQSGTPTGTTGIPTVTTPQPDVPNGTTTLGAATATTSDTTPTFTEESNPTTSHEKKKKKKNKNKNKNEGHKKKCDKKCKKKKHKHHENLFERQENHRMPVMKIGIRDSMDAKPVSVGSIVFKGIIQVMDRPDSEIYMFESKVIQHTDISKTYNKDPKDPPSSGANKLNSFVFVCLLTLITSTLAI